MARIMFVQRDAIEWLGVMYLSAALRQHGHESRIAVEAEEGPNLDEAVCSFRPDIVAFSCLTSDFAWATGRAAALKKLCRALVVFGGTHVTQNPERAIAEPGIDMICLGEGEEAIVDLAHAADAGRAPLGIANLWVKSDGRIERNDVRPLLPDLDTLPFPDRTLYSRYRFSRRWGNRPVSTSRGCPYRCSYCHNDNKLRLYANKGKAVRWRSVDRVLEEIAALRAGVFVSFLHFIDDGFALDPRWLLDFLPRLAAQGGKALPFYANMRADMVNEELCRALAQYGPRRLRLRIAVECGDEAYRQQILNKQLTNADLLRAAGLFHKHRIPFATYNMFALPGETLAQAEETLRLNARMRPNDPISFIYKPYPGTRLAGHALAIGAIDRLQLEALGAESGRAFFHSASPLRQPDIRRIENLQRLFPFAVKLPLLLPWALRAARRESLAPVFHILRQIWDRLTLLHRLLVHRHNRE